MFGVVERLKDNPQSKLRRRILIHQLAPAYGTNRQALYNRLEELEAFPPVSDAWGAKREGDKPTAVQVRQDASGKRKKRGTADIRDSRVNSVTADISRDLRKARARSFGGW